MGLFGKSGPQDKCPLCKKYGCRCNRNPRGNEKTKKQITNKAGKQQTVTVNTGRKVDARGNTWCPLCDCRMNPRCSNVRCANH